MSVSSVWRLSPEARVMVAKAIAQFIEDYGSPGFAFYPLITWREGGWMSREGETPTGLADRYDLALIPRQDIGASNFVARS